MRSPQDAVDEWMELSSLPQMFEFHPEMRPLIDLTGDAVLWRRPP